MTDETTTGPEAPAEAGKAPEEGGILLPNDARKEYPIPFPVGGATPTGGKKSVRERLKESEARAIGLVKYAVALEETIKTVLDYSSECYAKLEVIITPGIADALKALEQICIVTAPICQDVEDMQLHPKIIAAIMAEGGAMMQVNEIPKGAPDAPK